MNYLSLIPSIKCDLPHGCSILYKGIPIVDHVECYKHYVFYYTGVYFEKVEPYFTSHGLKLSIIAPGIRADTLDNHCRIHLFLSSHRCSHACQAAFRDIEHAEIIEEEDEDEEEDDQGREEEIFIGGWK